MIVVTGAAGFIGSCLVRRLNDMGFGDIVIADDFSTPLKNKNLSDKIYTDKVERGEFFRWLKDNHKRVELIFHLGARTDTTEFNKAVFDELNVNYSKAVWNACVDYDLPLIYASSAATYGLGEFGYEDNHEIVGKLKPLNPYGESKNEFDKWVLAQNKRPHFWAGLKFFNVYGPNEYHKGRMASVIFHAYNQIKETGKIKLFRSHKPEFKDGMQLRDFIYVKDVADTCCFFMTNKGMSGIFNIGTGKARTFLDLANSVFNSLKKPANIEFIDTPADIRDKYQYFTEASISKLRKAGYNNNFYSLEEGVSDYVRGYLAANSYY